MNSGWFSIDTPHLTLRDLALDDLSDMCKLCMDPEVTKYLDYIKMKDEAAVKRWLIDKIKHNNENPRHSYNFAITENPSDKMVGWIGIGKTSDKTKGDMDFGYALKKEYWGKGYASEALKAVLEFGLKRLKVGKIVGDCDIRNTASIKVMEKAGMKYEKTDIQAGKVSKYYSITSSL